MRDPAPARVRARDTPELRDGCVRARLARRHQSGDNLRLRRSLVPIVAAPAAPFEAAAAEHRDERLAHTAGAEAAFSAPNQDAAVTGLLARAVQRGMTWTEAHRHGLSRAAPVAQTVHGHGEWKLCAAWLVPGGGIEEGQV
jgi:hypothetical protein